MDLQDRARRFIVGDMPEGLVEKLGVHLQHEMDSEVAVVYLLVGLRKLLEQDGKKRKFELVNFYGQLGRSH